ncbi:MAG: hypothetical protein LUO99_05975 [Methanomicrobiales archaeon]|nr:hypothetical protein [Methanomicrobiales archaeon]MDD1646409.1 hypothetical protein [Methanomicrobiales archaeon]
MQLASFLFVVLLSLLGLFLLGRAFLTMGRGVHDSFPLSRRSLVALAIIFALLIVSVVLMIWGLA